MADLSAKKKKRKQSGAEEEQKPRKTHRFNGLEEEKKPKKVGEEEESSKRRELGGGKEVQRPWRNLQLILLIQSKEIDIEKKVELAFDFVNSRVKGGNDVDEDYETVKVSRLLAFLNDWVLSLLMSTEKKIKVDGGVIEACLDYRCWVIFKFCLEESLRLQVSLSFSRNFLRAVSCIARHALSLITDVSLDLRELFFIGEEFELYRVFLDCVSLVLLSHGGLSNENLDLWISTVYVVLQFINKVFDQNIEGGSAGSFSLRFSCLVFEPFAKFLKVHPIRKNGFHSFVDELLEPLLQLLAVLRLHCDRNGPSLTGNLLAIVEEVLSQGLFHPVHIDGFLSLRSMEKYAATSDGKTKDTKVVNKSYHRHFFDKMEKIVAGKKELVLSGLGQLFHLLVDRVRKQKVVSMLSEETIMVGETGGLHHFSSNLSERLHASSNVSSENIYIPVSLNAEKRRSLLDFFVQIMEPLFLQMNCYLEAKLEAGPMMMDVHCTLKSMNNLLASFLDEKLYIKTDDISDGAGSNFLKKVYNVILSFANNFLCLLTYNLDIQMQKLLTLLSRELLIAVGCLIDIEYEVIENDLTSLWLIMLSYLAYGQSCKDVPGQSLLASQVLELGCQMVNLYSELRQVKTAVFALCGAMRFIVSKNKNEGSKLHSGFWSLAASLPDKVFTESIGMLLSTQEFRLTIHNGIKSIPEGQVGEFIQQLGVDISSSVESIKNSGSVVDTNEFVEVNVRNCGLLSIDLQIELFGRGLSEIYPMVLDSLTVTVGNSSLVGRSIKELITVICPYMTLLVAPQQNGVKEFIFSIMGRNSDELHGNKGDLLKLWPSIHWLFIFFFRLYMSSRSLFRQAVSLMTPAVSKKLTAAVGDSLAAYSGMDWLKMADWTNQGYFSWIVQPSDSLLDVIRSVSDIYSQSNVADFSSLVYILNTMALQRLVDLNKQIKSLEYILQSNDYVVHTKLLDETGLSLYRKRTRKWGKHMSFMEQEAADLTEFILSYLSLFGDDELPFPASDDETSQNSFDQPLKKSDKWILGVSSVNEKSLPAAIWWVMCQDIDIWSIHARKKKLKTFLSYVICTSIPYMTRSFAEVGKHCIGRADLIKITVGLISSELLADSSFYEHRFVRRHLASRFCHLLEQSVLPLFNDLSVESVDLTSSPNWQEVLSSLENSLEVFSGRKPMTSDKVSERKTFSRLSKEKLADISWESNSKKVVACQNLLHFLCWMDKGFFNSKSFSRYVICVLNLERLLIGSLLKQWDKLSLDRQHELLRLLLTCRRALKHIIMAYCDEKNRITQSLLNQILSEDSFPILWLLKSASVVIGLEETVLESCSHDAREVTFSLMDHTAQIFLALSKYRCTCAVQSIVDDKINKEQAISSVSSDQSCSNKFDSLLDNEAWKNVFTIATSLKEQIQGLTVFLNNGFYSKNLGDFIDAVNLNKLSSIISCFSGFLWGLAYALNDLDATSGDYKLEIWKCEPLPKINDCMDVFADLTSVILHILFNGHGNFLKTKDKSGSSSSMMDSVFGEQHHKPGIETNYTASSNIGDSGNSTAHKHTSQEEGSNSVASVLCKLDPYECQSLKSSLLQSLINGDHPRVAVLIRQLLVASSAILRLNLQTRCTALSNFMQSFLGISQILLLEFLDYAEVREPLCFVWLDGALMYLQELAGYFPLTNPTSTKNLYAKLIELHLKALGKCISLQGKGATLASHETESSTKMLHGHLESSKESLSHSSHYLEEFKARLRISFKVLIRKPSELHLLSAIQAIERALVGVHEAYPVIYEINTGNADGGKVSSTIAAGIDCLDMVLEYASGRKRLNVVKRHIQSLIAALFNIILHLRSPMIFYGMPAGIKGIGNPDPGAVTLMCVEILTRVSGKYALFELDSWHIAQLLRIPAALFQDFVQLKVSGDLLSSSSVSVLENKDCNPAVDMHSYVVDRHFSIKLFSACCRLLYTTLKHRKSETEQCVALLQDSACVLLHCLESVKTDMVNKNHYFSSVVQEGVKCACFLRRIYEELRQQKDVFGKHCFKFLAGYIWVYSGRGPLKSGIKREIDEALRPGVYALIDVCSADDLQHLHSSFGEGPCRNTLAALQHDYKLNFQYGGKV